jgi:hypothetical protein
MDKEIVKQIFQELLCHILNRDLEEFESYIEQTKRIFREARGVEEKEGLDRIKKAEKRISLTQDKYKKINDLINKI